MRFPWHLSYLLISLATARSIEPGTSRNRASQQLVFPSGFRIDICPGAFKHMKHVQEEFDQYSRLQNGWPYVPLNFIDEDFLDEDDEELARQFEYEDRTGLPFYRDRAYEQEYKDDSLVVKIYQDDECTGDLVANLTEPAVCLSVKGGWSTSIESISSLCQLWTYSDEHCQEDPQLQCDAIFGWVGVESGCATGEYHSVQVVCRDELPPYDDH